MRLVKREHPEAQGELGAAADWYDTEEPGLGDVFHDATDNAIDRIAAWPHAAHMVPDWTPPPIVRSTPVQGFPYRIVYYVTDEGFVIVAYAHSRRKPGYWRHRVEQF